MGRAAVDGATDLALADRRGGGRAGLGFSTSCSSCADTKDDCEEAFSLLSIEIEVDTRAWNEGERVRSWMWVIDRDRACRDPLREGGIGWRAVVLLTAASCTDFLRIGGGGAPSEFFRSMLTLDSLGPSTAAFVRSTIGFGLTGGGVRVLILCKGSMSLGSSSFGSGGKVKVRLGLGERTGGEAVCEMCRGVSARFGGGVVGRFCSNMFTREVVGGMGVSSTALCSSAGARTMLATETAPLLLALLGRGRTW